MKYVILLFLLASYSIYSQDKNSYNYKKAVNKSFHFKKLKRPSTLFNINENNSRLHVSCNPRWNCVGGKNNWSKNPNIRIRMVSWVSAGTANRFFAPLAGTNKSYNTGNRFLWVSAYPQVKNFCQNINSSDIALRLRQYMGLPPDANKSHFVHIWVRPSDLFRPCYDEGVLDKQCDYSSSPKISSTHNKWMRDQLLSAYPKNGTKFPWTRLGYTYDWGNPKSYIGASEYVIKANSDIFIESIAPTGIYCAK
jgi:hypothetical protein